MSVRLPLVPSIPNYRFGTALAGAQFVIDVRWNARDEAWYMDIREEDETLIRAGIKVVLGTLIGGRVTADKFPLGVFIAADLTARGEEAGLADLGDRVIVDFYSFEELA